MWVLVARNIPVAEDVRPKTLGIYWAKPYKHPYERDTVQIYTSDRVVLLSHEYTELSEERLQQYIDRGWQIHQIDNENYPIDLSLIEKGRVLCEEEREIIWALMLDGLTELQACEEYYTQTHTELEKLTYCYLPTPEIIEEYKQYFGDIF